MNLATIVDGHPADALAFISRNRPTTYGELRRQVDRVRAGLAALGVTRGDRIAIVCGNHRGFVVAELAVLGLGAVVVPLNPASPTPELTAELAVTTPVAVVLDAAAVEAWSALDRAAVASVAHVIVTDGVTPPPGGLALAALGEGCGPVPVADVAPDALAALLFTSGTAGAPRAAMLTHGNLRSNLDQALAGGGRLEPDDVVFGLLPLFHVYGLTVVLHATLVSGAAVVLVQRFDPATALDTVESRGVTVFPGVPPVWAAFAAFPADVLAPLRQVRLALSGAARLDGEVAAQLAAKVGLTVCEGYGLTEASPVVTTSVGLPVRVGSIGRPVPGVEVRIVEADGTDVEPGDPGELLVRGPNVFAGYWGDPAATAAVLDADGWLHTGDVAVADDTGDLELVDRAKDLVIVSGFNVYPREVEEVLAGYPGVVDVAVVGVPHPHTGEAVKAYVVLAAGVEADEEQLIAHAARHLARYKCPTKVLFVDALPHGVAGKLLRRELR